MGVPQRKQCLETPTPDPQGGGEQHISDFQKLPLTRDPNQLLIRASRPQEGRIMIVVLRGMGCGGRGSVVARFMRGTNDSVAYGEVVWS